MNEHLNFWRNWTFSEKTPLFAAISILILLSMMLCFAWFKGLGNIVTWDTVSELKEKIIQTSPLFLDQFSFTASTPLWYVSESYLPSLAKTNVYTFYTFLAVLLLGLSFILAALSRLRGFWFLVGAIILGGVLVALRAENLFLVSRNWPFLVVFTLAGVLYYLSNIYASKLDIFKTMVAWLVLWILLAFLINYSALINEPFISLAAYGLVGGLALTAIFIFLSSHEIVSGLFWVVSNNSQKGKSSLSQVVVISIIFLVNALLIFLENSKRIESSVFIASPIIIYLINLVLGFWGFKNISEQKSWFSYRGVGVWLYLGLALVSTAAILLAYFSANDPLTDLIEDFISISFLAVGLSFLVYVILNFWQLVKAGLPFHKVIYKPPFSRLVFARIVAIFLVIFLFSMKNRYSIFQLQAGLNNTIGDFCAVEGDLKSAEVYYKNGTNYDLSNVKSNISLASLAVLQGDNIAAAYFYKQAGQKNPNPQAILGYSKALEANGMYFDAVFSLNEGSRQFPNDHHIYTNLARLQAKSGAIDSVLTNLNKALSLCKKCETENVNLLAFYIENGKREKLTEMMALTKTSVAYSYKANETAIKRILAEPFTFSNFMLNTDSALSVSQAAYLLNSFSNNNIQNDTEIDAATIQKLQNKEGNVALYEQLKWALANQEYYRENKVDGIKNLMFLADSPSKLSSLYFQNLGLWFMREGAYFEAIKNWAKAGDSSSVALLEKANVKEILEKNLKAQAQDLGKDFSLENYKSKLNKAPLNPYFLVKLSDFLAKNKKGLEAYNVVFYGQEFVKDSPELITTFIKRAVELSMFEYAETGLMELKPLVSNDEFNTWDNFIANKKPKGF